MTLHITAQAVLVVLILMSGIAVVWRGLTGTVRRYTVSDAVFGAIECCVWLWLVAVIAR